MAENSKIAWTNHTYNPWVGCTRVSPGCQNCYAEQLMDRRYHRVKWGPRNPRARTKTWRDVVRWNAEAAASGSRPRVFCASLADWLDEEVDAAWRADLFALIEKCHHLDWLMLTKRPENALGMMPRSWVELPLPHVWFGVTAEDQAYWDLRVNEMVPVPAALKWVSYEPSLGPLENFGDDSGVNWLIIGGESEQGSPAREFKIEWAEQAIELCRVNSVVPFVKQLGGNATYQGKPYPTKDRAGADQSEWPESIRVREFPASMVTANV